MKVLIADSLPKTCEEILTKHNINVTNRPDITSTALLEDIKNYDALIVRSRTQVTKEVIEAGKNLRVVARAGAGVDNIDVNAATERKILVVNAPGANAISACELTCALISCLPRNIVQGAVSLKGRKWERTKFQGTELFGKTLAVLGLGRVGREVALRMNAFGMKVIGYDPIVSAEEAKKYATEKMELEEIWPLADFITVYTPLLPSTRDLINSAVLDKCKKGVYIVNVGRGGLVNENDLLQGLNKNIVGGAALDVFEKEPPKDNVSLELIDHPKVIATPHLGASTDEAQARVAIEIAEQLISFIDPVYRRDHPMYPVNPNVLSN